MRPRLPQLTTPADHPAQTGPKPVPAPEPIPTGLSALKVHRNLLLTGDGLWAWFVLDPVSWWYGVAPDRASLLDSITLRVADLVGHRIHLRGTAQPVPWTVWAEKLDRDVRGDRPVEEMPRLADGRGWPEWLAASQEEMADGKLENPVTYLGVRITTDKMNPDRVVDLEAGRHLTADMVRHKQILDRVTNAVSKEGFGARRTSSRGLAWLLNASLGLLCPLPANSFRGPTDGWGEHDLDNFTAPVRASAPPASPTLRLRVLRDGRPHERHVAIASMGIPERREALKPSTAPWLAATLRRPYPVEWTATLDVMDGATVASAAEYTRRRAENIKEHWEEHGERPPLAVDRGIKDSIRIEDEVLEAPREIACRVTGPIRFAVAGHTEKEALDRLADLKDAYAKEQKIPLVESWAQHAMYREFIPGEPVDATGFQRVMPGYFLAAAVPHASTSLGDGEGPLLGEVADNGRRPVHFDTNWGPEHGVSGLITVQGDLGAGKSVLISSMVDDNYHMDRQQTLFDPSSPLGVLVRRYPKARHIDLSGAEPGILTPHAQVMDPRRGDYPTDAEFDAALREADAERRDLAVDTFMDLLPAQLVNGPQGAGALEAVEAGVNEAGGAYGTNPWRAVHAMERDGETAAKYAKILRAQATMKGGRLIFPEDEHSEVSGTAAAFDALLTILTAKGINPPRKGVDRAHWNRAERMAAPVLHLASRFATRMMYANRDPKAVYVDEGGIIGAGESSFQSFMLRASLDSRKHDTAVVIAGQNPGHHRAISAEITNLIGAAFAGRMRSVEVATFALPYLGIDEGYGYEKVLTRLKPGQWLMRDYASNVGKLDNNLSRRRPDLLALVNTTPGRRRANNDELVA